MTNSAGPENAWQASAFDAPGLDPVVHGDSLRAGARPGLIGYLMPEFMNLLLQIPDPY